MPLKSKSGSSAIIVLVTCATKSEACSLAASLVEKRLAACSNISGSPVTSIYRWKGKVERAKEVLLVLKSTRAAFPALEREVRRMHSYDVPEIIALPVIAGSRPYLAWLTKCIQ